MDAALVLIERAPKATCSCTHGTAVIWPHPKLDQCDVAAPAQLACHIHTPEGS